MKARGIMAYYRYSGSADVMCENLDAIVNAANRTVLAPPAYKLRPASASRQPSPNQALSGGLTVLGLSQRPAAGGSSQILAWERGCDNRRDGKFVELGPYLCEVRSGQYWRMENLKSFDEFLERRFSESRRKAYYLMFHPRALAAANTQSIEAARLVQGCRVGKSRASGAGAVQKAEEHSVCWTTCGIRTPAAC